MLRIIKGRRDSPAFGNDAWRRPKVIDELAPLAQRAKTGDEKATRTLLAALGSSMLQVIRRILGESGRADVEDVFQDAAFGFVEALENFRGDCSVRHFACRVAVLT